MAILATATRQSRTIHEFLPGHREAVEPDSSTKPMLRPLLFLGFSLLACSSMQAAVTLPALISDHMVLQKSAKSAVWGTASPGEKVTATLDSAAGEAVADAAGRWRIELDLSQEKEGPFDLVIAGENRIVVSDVLVGEVWLASGQSNMAFSLAADVGGKEEIAAPPNARLRQFHVGIAPSPDPKSDCAGKWVAAAPATLGDFTAVGYYFAKNLQQSLGAPVGIIDSTVPGTPIESWTSLNALEKNPDLKIGAERYLKRAADTDAYASAIDAWLKQYNRADKAPDDPSLFPMDTIPGDAKPVTLPGLFSAAGLPDAGAVWIWKKITLSPGDLGLEQLIRLASPGGFETLYWNGKRLEGDTPETDLGSGTAHIGYVTPDKIDNILAIRLYSPGGNGGIGGDPQRFTIGSIPLQGEWMGKAEYEFPPLGAGAMQAYPKPPNGDMPRGRPAYLFNGMIEPLLPCTLKGVLWYQGENNTGRAYQYQTELPSMIEDWRAQSQSALPFYLCQLPNFMGKKPAPSESAWAELREAQTKALSLPDTGEAVLIDLGEEGTVHPRDKHEAGRRLSLIALAKTYGKQVPSSGPVYQSFQMEGDKIRVLFATDDGGLVAKPLPSAYQPLSAKPQTVPLVRNSPAGELEGFAVCGADHQWAWADAKIDGDSVLVWSSAVPAPVAARYAWADNPTCNLYNQAGLPAGPFRTDDFPLTTEKARY